MSSIPERIAEAVMAHLRLLVDGALLELRVAYLAHAFARNYFSTVSAIGKIRDAPSCNPSDLRSILTGENDSGNSGQDDGNLDFDGGKLVVVRGAVGVKSALKKESWENTKSSGADLVVSRETGDRGVILQQTQACVYNEWKGFLGWPMNLLAILPRFPPKHESSITRMVPFILTEDAKFPLSDHVVVNMEGSQSPLPLTTVYQNLTPINASDFTVLQAFFGSHYPIGVLTKEKILPFGKVITAVGTCNFKDGIPVIKSCSDIPCFLSDFTKEEILADLSFKAKVYMWCGIIFGTIAVGLLGHCIVRNWFRYKEWRRHQHQTQQQLNRLNNQAETEEGAAEESEEITDGELCVVCLMRRRCSAFVPCGHLVCCQRCALSVEREASPTCPVCQQRIRNSVRIYGS